MEDRDREFLPRLLRTLARSDPWAKRTRVDEPFVAPDVGSALAGDDRRVHPYQTSHIAWHSISHAVDHLQMLQAVLRTAQVIHMYSPYSVVRGALENACTAVWLLAPGRRLDRLERRLQLATADIIAGEDVKILIGKPGPRSRDQRIEGLRTIAARNGLAERRATKRVGYREIVKTAASDLGDDEGKYIELAYRVCSAIAHGDLWPTVSATDRVELPGAPVGMVHLQVKASVGVLLWVTLLATDMTERAWKLYDERCRGPFPG